MNGIDLQNPTTEAEAAKAKSKLTRQFALKTVKTFSYAAILYAVILASLVALDLHEGGSRSTSGSFDVSDDQTLSSMGIKYIAIYEKSTDFRSFGVDIFKEDESRVRCIDGNGKEVNYIIDFSKLKSIMIKIYPSLSLSSYNSRTSHFDWSGFWHAVLRIDPLIHLVSVLVFIACIYWNLVRKRNAVVRLGYCRGCWYWMGSASRCPECGRQSSRAAA